MSVTNRPRPRGRPALGAAIAAAAPLVLFLAGPAPADVADARLTDQNGATDSLGAHRGRVVAVLIAEVGGLRALKKWELALRERMTAPDAVDFLRVADVPSGRGITRERILAKLDGRVPPDVSILIDMERVWQSSFGLDTDESNLLLLDRAGRLVHLFRGRPDERIVTLAAERLAELMARE